MRALLAGSLLAILLSVSLTSANLVELKPFRADERVTPMGVRTYPGVFKADELASAQASGNGFSPLGIYVFDANGNCVARDDIAGSRYCDEQAVEWISDAVGRYAVDVRNTGLEVNRYTIAIR